ncbi:UV damage repair protein UvrX (plasmid) [Planococcus glaciei]|uniref:UV damage repair protein UvrX n=1 Tax=Planococcus glaciei TaxID=459472 RepID=A0A7H8QG41_9BACL|nr:UV damage repair protein UvrX [Planococcus glaciei]QDY47004.1 UV damage repair protein UvrX [Planococcus glaciei]QKX52783.1 UV damage repair protein UvrX [Planococcus glaciei]QKX52886.1 UV damage repair protein UvrX [Planococcus glaciei]
MESREGGERTIACLDMRSFYASCAAVEAGMDPLEAYIAVVGNQERKGSVVLAASPRMKQEFGVRTGTRLFEIPGDPRIRLLEPKMGFFLKVSMAITDLLAEFVPKDCIHVYSVDESFIDFTRVESFWGGAEALIRHIQDALVRQFGLPSAVGVGPNMLLAKLALDLEAKKSGYAEWTYTDVPKKLWPVAPLSKMWGIGSRTEQTLNGMGIFSVGDLACTDVAKLEGRFGIMGHQLYQHANGIDLSELGAPLIEGQVSYGKGQILYRDYTEVEDILTIILEMCEDVAMRARQAGRAGRTVQLGVGYSKTAFGGGFSRSRSIEEATNETLALYRVCQELFREHYLGKPVRQISLSLSNLEEESSMQLSLFEAQKWENRKLGAAMDQIRNRYGYSAIYRAVSGTEAGTAIARTRLIGGHQK